MIDIEKCKEIIANFKHGDVFTAKQYEASIEGKISFDKKKSRVYLCYNGGVKGDRAPDMLGYDLSWVLDDCIKDLVIKPAPVKSVIINDYQIY